MQNTCACDLCVIQPEADFTAVSPVIMKALDDCSVGILYTCYMFVFVVYLLCITCISYIYYL